MMNLNNYAENLGKMNTIIYVLIDLKIEIKEDNVLAMETETHTFFKLQN